MRKIFFLSILVLFLSCLAWAEDFYTWTDKEGRTNIVNTAPESADAEKHVIEDSAKNQSDARMQETNKRWAEADAKYEREKERINKESQERQKQNAIEKCERYKKREKEYRYEYRNAKSQSMTDFYKQQLDEIEEICKKAGM